MVAAVVVVSVAQVWVVQEWAAECQWAADVQAAWVADVQVAWVAEDHSKSPLTTNKTKVTDQVTFVCLYVLAFSQYSIVCTDPVVDGLLSAGFEADCQG